MAIVASAPGRVNLIGEHTDYNGGRCLPFAIDLRTTASVTRRDDRTVRVTSARTGGFRRFHLDDIEPGAITGWAAYPCGVLWALAQDGWPLWGVEIAIDGDVPLGAGLSSSAALECAVATAIAALHGWGLDKLDHRRELDQRRHLADLCIRAETEFVGAPTGGMDQTTALLAEAGQALLLDFGQHADSPEDAVPLPLVDAALTVLVIDPGHGHALADGGGYATRRAECTAAADALGVDALCSAAPADVDALTDPTLRARARHAVTEDRRVGDAVAAIDARDWAGLGELLTASHASLRDDFEVSTPALDLTVHAALAGGALGARLVGGGFGGSAIALTAEDRVDDVRNAIDAAFTSARHPRPTYHQVVPAAGARLISPA